MDDKACIVEETLVPGAVVSEIARRHGALSPQQLFGRRRAARRLAGDGEDAGPSGPPWREPLDPCRRLLRAVIDDGLVGVVLGGVRA